MNNKTVSCWFALFISVIGLFVYQASLHNEALFHHRPTIYTDPVLEISLLQNCKFFPKIFTKEFSINTPNEYRPVSYSILLLLKTVIDNYNYEAWHAILMGIHFLNALLLFFMLREMISRISSFLLSLILLVHPFSSILINDISKIYILWGIQFVLLTLLFYILYLRKRLYLYLIISVVFFILSVFTIKQAILVPLFIVLFHLLYDSHRKALVICSSYFVIVLGFLDSYNLDSSLLFILFLVMLLVLGYNISGERRKFFILLRDLLPFLTVVLVWYLVYTSVDVKPIYVYPLDQIKEGELLRPFETWFVWMNLMAKQKLYIMLFIPLLFVPFCINGKLKESVLLFLVVFFIILNIRLNGVYANDITYWEKMDQGSKGKNAVVRLNLAKAYVEDSRTDQAKNILLGLKYEEKIYGIVEDIVDVELGRVYQSEHRNRLAGYYFFGRPKRCLPGAGKIAKWRLIYIGDFLFQTGFVSYAENYFASAFVLDPYDIRLFNRLGEVLLYKNFFRAAGRYFGKALEYDDNNDIAIYHSAFVYKMIGDEERYAFFEKKWQQLHNTRKRMEFQDVYDRYSFNKETIRKELSNDPVTLFITGRTKFEYVYKQDGKVYNLWEVPFEIGKYFYSQEKYDDAMEYLSYAYNLNKDSEETVEYLKKAYQKKLKKVK